MIEYYVQVIKPRICGRQMHRQNAVSSNTSASPLEITKDHFRINVAIPFLEEITGALQARYVLVGQSVDMLIC